MKNRNYTKTIHPKSLTKELENAGFIKYPNPGFRFFGVSYSPSTQSVIVHLADDATPTEESTADSVVTAHQVTAVTFKVTSNAPLDTDSVPKVPADGITKHTLTIQKIDPNGNNVNVGSEVINITSNGVPVSNAAPSLVNGAITVDAGPISMAGDVVILIVDSTGKLDDRSIRIRFTEAGLGGKAFSDIILYDEATNIPYKLKVINKILTIQEI